MNLLGRIVGLGILAMGSGAVYQSIAGEQPSTPVLLMLIVVSFALGALLVRYVLWRIPPLRPGLRWLYPYGSWTGEEPLVPALRMEAPPEPKTGHSALEVQRYERDRARRRALWSFVAALFAWFVLLPVSSVVAPVVAVVVVVVMNLFLRKRDERLDEEQRRLRGERRDGRNI